MELCERGSLLDLIRKPENITGIDEEEFLRVFSHLGNCLNIILHFESIEFEIFAIICV